MQHALLQHGLGLQARLGRLLGPLRVGALIPYPRPQGVPALRHRRIECSAQDQAPEALERLRMQGILIRRPQSSQAFKLSLKCSALNAWLHCDSHSAWVGAH